MVSSSLAPYHQHLAGLGRCLGTCDLLLGRASEESILSPRITQKQLVCQTVPAVSGLLAPLSLGKRFRNKNVISETNSVILMGEPYCYFKMEAGGGSGVFGCHSDWG